MAAAYARLGDYDKAIEHQETAINNHAALGSVGIFEDWVLTLHKKLSLYKSGKPYTDE